MEVHHHSSPAPGGTHTPRKKWTHYFWEFLMLFLAVFCGFLAEYQLEHKIEKEKANQYIKLFYDDLKTDSSRFSHLLLLYKYKLSLFANRYQCYDGIMADRQSTDCLQELFINSTHFPDLVYTDRTLQQLKNAGGIRLLKQADADSILLYDNMIRQFKISETTSFQEVQTSLRNTLFSLVNFRARNKNELTKDIPFLYPASEELLNRYFNQLESYVKGCNDNYNDITNLKSKAIALIYYFKNKYHLE